MPVKDDLEASIRAACDARRWEEAATLALQGYGPEIMSYLVAIIRDVGDADVAFGVVAENLWRSLPTFRWECTMRTYAYALARHAWTRGARDAKHHAGRQPLSSPSVQAVVANVRSQTATLLRTETQDKLARLRETLDPEDRTLLILRINRKLSWREIARVLADDDSDSDAAVDRRAAGLRKRFERLKADLRGRLAADGD